MSGSQGSLTWPLCPVCATSLLEKKTHHSNPTAGGVRWYLSLTFCGSAEPCLRKLPAWTTFFSLLRTQYHGLLFPHPNATRPCMVHFCLSSLPSRGSPLLRMLVLQPQASSFRLRIAPSCIRACAYVLFSLWNISVGTSPNSTLYKEPS